ncbi:hypothetical protein V6N13_104771 [Hibiscus sabdariffa]
MVTNSGDWCWDNLNSLLPSSILLHLAAIKPPLPCFPSDALAWTGEPNGRFSIRSAYNSCTNENTASRDKVWSSNHKYHGLPKIKFFLWLLYHGRLMTNAEHYRHHFTSDSSCPCCDCSFEDINHMVRKCPLAQQTWTALRRNWVVRLNHIPLNLYKLADSLAKLPTSDSLDLIVFDTPLISVRHLLDTEVVS